MNRCYLSLVFLFIFVLFLVSCAGKQNFETLFLSGAKFYEEGDRSEAKKYFLEADKNHTDRDSVTSQYALMQRYLGVISYDEGDYLSSQKYLRRSLNLIEENLGKSHPEYPEVLGDLGTTYVATNQIADAIRHFTLAVRHGEEILGEAHPLVIRNLNNIGAAYQSARGYLNAEKNFQEALERHRRSNLGDDLELSTIYNNFGNLYTAKKSYPEAINAYQESLRIRTKILGRQNIQTADILNNLAEVAFLMKNFSEAGDLLRESLQIGENTFGMDHPGLLPSLHKLARFYEKIDDRLSAELIYQRALEIIRTHPNTKALISNSIQHAYKTLTLPSNPSENPNQ